MDCQIVITQMGAYLDDELSANDSAVVKSHLRECERCSDLCNGQKLVDQSLRMAVLTSPVDTSALRNRVRQALPARVSKISRVSIFASRPVRWVGLGIAAVVLVAFGLVVFRYFRAAPVSNQVLYADLVDDYLEHGRPPGLNVGLDENRLKRQVARYQGVEKVMDYFRLQNYTLIHTQACILENTNFLHLIYQKDGRYLSVFFKPVDSPMLRGKPSETIGTVAVHEWTEEGYPLAALQGSHCVVLLIGELPIKDLHELADSTAPALPVGMFLPVQ